MDSLQQWPEPVVPVQSLSNAKTIPSRYIKPPSQRAAGDAASTVKNIPVVDLSAAATAKAISDACREWGFFQVVNHGVSLELVKRFQDSWRRFFHLPMAEKRRYANSPATYEGYGSRLGVDKDAFLDWVDYFFLHFLPPQLKDHNKWPSLPPCLRETTEEYGVEVQKLCRRVMKEMSAGLGLAADCLQQAFGGEEEGICIRVNFYPKCPQPELALGLSPHSDPGGLTVLLVDDNVRGLQVRKDGAWVTVEPIPGAFVINVADQIQIVSNAIYKSVEHRVIVNAEEERLSIAFFYNPKSDIPIGPVPELVVVRYKTVLCRSMSFDEYRLYIRRKGPRGKSQVEALESSIAS
ncbi:protein DMR6-LIKE OXYGENASE 1-like [Canna indica]|uniref:Protein DMR6-LIKE OXYGENASE 1-like n=1 Tax=Canna indica TaxID=4628 RepID=A0AAQ3QHJ6_9LILI|nr:protein DMR6-LIKE OXYGENASE 1-like [Canna indica]